LTPQHINQAPETSLNSDKIRLQSISLNEFIQSPLSIQAQYHYVNGLCRSLTDVPVNCPSVSDDLRSWRKDIDIHVPQKLFEAARDQLKLFDYIAFQDDLEGSIDGIFSLLNISCPEVPRLNNKEGKLAQIKRLGREVPPIDIDVIKSFQEADYLLYEYAKKLITE
jgi:hypothetical protein